MQLDTLYGTLLPLPLAERHHEGTRPVAETLELGPVKDVRLNQSPLIVCLTALFVSVCRYLPQVLFGY